MGKTKFYEKGIGMVVASGGVQGMRQRLTFKSHGGTFCADYNILYLGRILGYLDVCICQNLSNGLFIIYKQ